MFTLNPWLLLGATMVGIVTAVSAFVVERVQEKKRQVSLNRELSEMRYLRDQVTQLQLEIYTLSKCKKDKKPANSKLETPHRRTRTNTGTSATSDTDWNSAQDSSDLEFYDLSSDEEDSRASTIRPLSVILEGIDNRLDSMKNVAALKAILEELLQLFSKERNVGELVWRLAKCEYKLSQYDFVGNKTLHIKFGVDYCCQQQHQDHADDGINSETLGQISKWLAICLGAQIEITTSIRDKIRSSMQFKCALDTAAQHLPSDATVQYMLGRWALEVGELPWIDRKALSVMGGGDIGAVGPEAALDYFARANDLKADDKETKVYLAKALLTARGSTPAALRHLQEAQKLPKSADADDKVDIELKTLLAKYNSYT